MNNTTTYTRLTPGDREAILRGRADGDSMRTIAARIGRAPSTVSRELKKYGQYHSGGYCQDCAHRDAQKAMASRTKGRSRIREHQPLREYVHEKLRKRWSPQQIAHRLKQEYPEDTTMHVSHETIYTYVYVLPRGTLRKELIACLRREHAYRRNQNKRGNQSNRGRITDMISIEERPVVVEDRSVPGHWEGDIIVGKRKQSALGTLVERTTRTTMLVPLENRRAEHVRKAFAKAVKTLPGQMKLSLTYDQGREMAQHRLFTDETQMVVYFAHPRSPWERGTNENTNGLIRDFFPNGTDFNDVSDDEVKRVQYLLNTRPRRVLEWRTPQEALSEVLR